jgi:ribosomal protein S18 acetylase RimI-like enzyme
VSIAVGQGCAMTLIRTAVPTDIADVVALWNREGGPTRHAGQHFEAEQLLQRDPEALLLAIDGGRLVGTLIVGWDGWRCHLYRLAVEPAARRSGVARQLVAAGRERAIALGAVRIDAMVNADNSVAVAFWDNGGFEFDSEDRRWSLLIA